MIGLVPVTSDQNVHGDRQYLIRLRAVFTPGGRHMVIHPTQSNGIAHPCLPYKEAWFYDQAGERWRPLTDALEVALIT